MMCWWNAAIAGHSSLATSDWALFNNKVYRELRSFCLCGKERTPMLVDLVRTTTRDGVRLDGVFQPAAAPGGLALDAACFVHGTGSNFYGSTLFDAFAERLLAVGCSVLRINTRGHDLMSTAALA